MNHCNGNALSHYRWRGNHSLHARCKAEGQTSKDHRIIEFSGLEKTSEIFQSHCPPATNTAHEMMSLSATSLWSWNTSGDGDLPNPHSFRDKLSLISNQRQHANTHSFSIPPQDAASHEEQDRSLKEKESSSFHSSVWETATEKTAACISKLARMLECRQ